MEAGNKKCSKCDSIKAVKGERFCYRCKQQLFKEMERTSYLTDVGASIKTVTEQYGRKSTYGGSIAGACEFGSDGDDN